MLFSRLKMTAAALLSAILCACSTTGADPQHYELTKADKGRTLHLKSGDIVTVQLASNPTTGFQWEFGTPALDRKVVSLREDRFISPKGDLCGAPGKRSLSFQAEGPGRTDIRLIYVRPWEKNRPPAEEFSLSFEVEGGSGPDGNVGK